MTQAPLLRSVILLSLLTACASVDQSGQQTAAAEALAAELAAAQAESALQTAKAENASLQATNNALATQNAGGQAEPTATSQSVASSTPQPSPTRTLQVATQGPTSATGISAQVDSIKTCEGTLFAIVRVRNVGPETYQSAIVKLSDANGDEIRRSDGNNEFLPTATCPGNETPTLGPGEEKFVTVSLGGTNEGDTLLIRVTVCTEKGYGGNCWSSATSFIR